MAQDIKELQKVVDQSEYLVMFSDLNFILNNMLLETLIRSLKRNVKHEILRNILTRFGFKQWILKGQVADPKNPNKNIFSLSKGLCVDESLFCKFIVEFLKYSFNHKINPIEFFMGFGLDLRNCYFKDRQDLPFFVIMVQLLGTSSIKKGEDFQWILAAFNLFKDQVLDYLNKNSYGHLLVRTTWLFSYLQNDQKTCQNLFTKIESDIKKISIVPAIIQFLEAFSKIYSSSSFDSLKDLISWLVAAGLNLNCRDAQGTTVLMGIFANFSHRDPDSRYPTPDLIDAMIRNGARVLERDSENRTVLDYAKMSGAHEDQAGMSLFKMIQDEMACVTLLPSNKTVCQSFPSNYFPADYHKTNLAVVHGEARNLKSIVSLAFSTLLAIASEKPDHSQDATEIPLLLALYLMDEECLKFPLQASAAEEFQATFITPMFVKSNTQNLINFHKREINAAATVKPSGSTMTLAKTTPSTSKVQDKKENDEGNRTAETASTPALMQGSGLYNADGSMNFRALFRLHDAAIQQQSASAARDSSRPPKQNPSKHDSKY